MKRVSFVTDAWVIEIKVYHDPQGNKYALITLAYEIPIPLPPHLKNQFPPPPKPTLYQHILHIFIPEDKYRDNYRLWEKYKVKIYEDGSLEVTK